MQVGSARLRSGTGIGSGPCLFQKWYACVAHCAVSTKQESSGTVLILYAVSFRTLYCTVQ